MPKNGHTMTDIERSLFNGKRKIRNVKRDLPLNNTVWNTLAERAFNSTVLCVT